MTPNLPPEMLPDTPPAEGLVKPYPFTAHEPTPLPADLNEEIILAQLREVLGSTGGVQVFGREESEFKASITILNGAAKSHAVALVKPRNANHVSETIIFCRTRNLQLSVRAGGTGVHGWSIAGHVILDLSLLDTVTSAIPSTATSLQASFERLSLKRGSSSTQGSAPKRPSLTGSHGQDSAIKRSAHDMSDGDEDESGKRTRIHTAGDDGPSRSSGSDTGMSRGSSSEPRSSRSGDGHASTPITSGSDSGRDLKAEASGSYTVPPAPGVRMTYVNPSPTTTATSYPFVQAAFGAPSSSSSSWSHSFDHTSLAGSQRLLLNTNPDPPPYTIVTFGAGVKSKQLDSATAASQYGAYHVPTSAFPVGSGQFLLGGFGFIGRKHGLAMDNVVEAEVVLADGRIVWVGQGGKHGGEWKEDEDPEDVWWALRGAGTALGVVTRFRAKAYYLPSVFAGNFIYLFEKSSTPSLMRHIRDCIKGSPRTTYCNMILTAGPPNAPAIVVIQMCFSGSRSEGEMYVQAISSWDGGRCLFQDFSERTFERQQTAVEEVLKGGQGRKWFIKSDMLLSLTDEIIDETCARFNEVPDGCTWLFEYTGGGAVGDIKDSVFPPSHRDAAFTVAALHQWGHTEPPVEDTRCVTTAEDWINEVIHPNSPGGPLPCFLQSARGADVASAYGESWPRLKKIKSQFDPEGFFIHCAWPSGEESQLDTDTDTDKAIAVKPRIDKGKGKASGESDNIQEEKEESSIGVGVGNPALSTPSRPPSSSAIEAAREFPAFQRESALIVDPVKGGDSDVM
ncbi:hypothetical protein BCR39DRAFT_543520 [Naematelia encephala]|uniref:FAD-binding PCMH-type domain-containing protein n=1 Tax=Naematelia encephala TaxID=71784 RepID=A0A1Y2ASU4_9TREE|nr:hypothetical protein BCR39DRAFT_543520 [Naematelia encephala]